MRPVFFFSVALTAIYNIWLCLAELVLILLLYLFFQTGISRRKKEVMAYLDHMTSGVDVASRRTLISSPLPIAIFRPDTDDIIWSNERFPPPLYGDPDHLFETKLSALVPSFQSQWLLDETTSAPNPFPWATSCTWFSAIWSVPGDRTNSWPPPIGWMSQSTPGWRKFDATRPVVGILQVDNYEDLNCGLRKGERVR